MTDLRTAAQQALERLRKYHYGNGFAEDAECIADLEAALAQQAEPTRSQQMVAAGFKPRDRRLECDECGGKFTAQMLPIHKCAQQAEPVEPAKPVAQQAKPLTGLDMFLDPADGLKPKPYKPRAEPVLQTRKDGHYSVAYRCKCGHEQNVTEIVQGGRTYAGSGANWCDGCGDGPPVRVDAMQQQAEPVEPVAWAAVTENGKLYKAASTRESAERKAEQQEAKFGDTWRPLHVVPLYATPPQRKPLTEEEISAMAQKTWKLSVYYDAFSLLGTDNLVALVRAVEKASWEKNHGQA